MEKTKYIHYGSEQFYPELVMPISNEPVETDAIATEEDIERILKEEFKEFK